MNKELDKKTIEKLKEIEKILDETTPLLPPKDTIQMNIELTIQTP